MFVGDADRRGDASCGWRPRWGSNAERMGDPIGDMSSLIEEMKPYSSQKTSRKVEVSYQGKPWQQSCVDR